VNRLPADTREKTQEALFPTEGCIAYLSGVDEATKASVLAALSEAKFIEDRAAASRSLFDYPHDGKTCPTRHQSISVAPGGEYEGHHAWPGGLAVHEAYNLHVAQDFVRHFRAEAHDKTAFDNNVVTAAVVWHDWAKTVEFQWEKDRLVNYESKIAGTGSHHIIGLAEAMARHLPPRFVVSQACAHSLPDENGQNVIRWLQAAAIIARIDPVATGYLTRAADSSLRAAFTPECQVNFLSDQNWSSEGPALHKARAVLAELASDFGYAKTDAERYAAYENTVLAFYGADAIALSPREKVRSLVNRLKAQGRL